jgi:hypothetical protein
MAQTGYTPISIFYSTTASAAPTAGSLVAGELAINTNDGVLYYKDSSGVVQKLATKGGVGTSSTTQVLYNNAGLIAGSSNMTFNGTTLTTANDASISGLTVGKGGGATSQNTALGISAIGSSNTGNYSVGIGYQTLYSNTSGYSNTAVGLSAMYSNTTGANNTAYGLQALQANTTANNNTAVGFQAGYSNTTGTQIVAIGHQAGYSNSTGSANTFVGQSAGYSVTTANGITAIGFNSMNSGTVTGSNNTALGLYSLRSNTTGIMNSAIGGGEYGVDYGALGYNTTGSYNTAVGHYALKSNTTSSNIVAIGYQALYSGTTNIPNTTAVGYQAGYSATQGTNTYIGAAAGYNSTGYYNTFVGAGGQTGGGAGYAMTSGIGNTILGGFSGNNGGLDIRTASNYIVLSDGSGNPRGVFNNVGTFFVGTTSGGVTNTKSIIADISGEGYLIVNHTGTASGSVFQYFGYNGNPIGSITQNGTTGVLYNLTSDYRLKNNATPLTGASEFIMALKPKSWDWWDGSGKGVGFIAHEFMEVAKYSGNGKKDEVDADGKPVFQSIQPSSSEVMANLVAMVQELNEKVTALEAQLGAK